MTTFHALGILLALASGAATAGDFTGTYSLATRATVGQSTTYERYDLTRERRIDSTTVAMGAKDLGTLAIRPDGTYELRYWYYAKLDRAPVIRGRWVPTANGDPYFAEGAIKLVDAVPAPDRSPPMRAWYVYRAEDGGIDARYAPYAETVRLTPAGGARTTGAAANAGATAGRATATAAATPGAATANAATVTAATAPTTSRPAAAPAPSAAARTYLPDEVRAVFRGKTLAEAKAILGEPAKHASNIYYWNDVENLFPRCPNGCNWQSFSLRFGGPGDTVDSVELQSWRVE